MEKIASLSSYPEMNWYLADNQIKIEQETALIFVSFSSTKKKVEISVNQRIGVW